MSEPWWAPILAAAHRVEDAHCARVRAEITKTGVLSSLQGYIDIEEQAERDLVAAMHAYMAGRAS